MTISAAAIDDICAWYVIRFYFLTMITSINAEFFGVSDQFSCVKEISAW